MSHLGTVWGELKNPPDKSPRFLPGMSGQAQLVLSSPKQSLTVPPNAIVSDGPERYVLVETSSTAKASEYQKRSVVIGVEADDWTQILGRNLRGRSGRDDRLGSARRILRSGRLAA